MDDFVKIVLVFGPSKTENDDDSEDEAETAVIFMLGVVPPGGIMSRPRTCLTNLALGPMCSDQQLFDYPEI